MSLLSKLETKLEGAVEGLFTRAFRDRLQPLEIAKKIQKAMHESKILTVGTAYAPNRFKVRLNPLDYYYLSGISAAFVPELEGYISEYAGQINCRLADSPSVILVEDASVKVSATQIESEITNTPRELSRKMRNRAQRSSYLLHVTEGPDSGRQFDVADGETILGRDGECGIPLSDPSSSRNHARLLCANGEVTIEDLGSTNGTYVNSEQIDRYSLLPGDVIGIGTTSMELKVVHTV